LLKFSQKKELKMKKVILSLGCLCLLALSGSLAWADGDAPVAGSGPRLGIEGGIDLANFNGENVNDVFASRLGFAGGALLELPLGPTLSIQPELLYEQKGGKYNGNAYQVDYVEVPLLLDITLIGPLGILLGPAFDGNVFNSGLNNVNNGEISLVGGLQLNLSQFLVSARYEAGLTNVTTTQGFQNGTFTLLAGLLFI
jgi:hypothetical protein